MVLEGIVTTNNPDGSPHLSPMGPIVDNESFDRFTLRPFRTSTTYVNLKAGKQGVLHVTDDAQLIARAAIHQLDQLPELVPAKVVAVQAIASACRWFEFQVARLDDREQRTTIDCQVLHQQHVRDFFGFNRAKHAVVEAAILATRVHLLPGQEILDQFAQLRVLVDKTGGPQEEAAFSLLKVYVEDQVTSSEA